MRALVTLDAPARARLLQRAESILNGLIEYEDIAKAQSYDRDSFKGHYAASPPAGVSFDIDGDRPPPVFVSPYHHFKRSLELAIDEVEFRRVLRLAQRMLDRLEAPSAPDTIGGTNWEEVEIEILEQGFGTPAPQIAAAFELSVNLVRQIREENDVDPESGIDVEPKAALIRKAGTLRHVENWPIERIAQTFRKSPRTIQRYLERLKNDLAA